MTVCYGFVCRRREILDFTPADRNALSQILATGRASAAPEPSTWATMILGFAGLGFAGYRKAKSGTSALSAA